ncbi:MAG TPA: hypothetical protein VGO91_10770, partial [Pyrinomonadaceae bacterium]|nr:hypothetical protein [Pyrinomonadaceae bacterium]
MAEGLTKLVFEIAANTGGAQGEVRKLREVFAPEMRGIYDVVNGVASQIESRVAYSFGYTGLIARGAGQAIAAYLDPVKSSVKVSGDAGAAAEKLGKQIETMAQKYNVSAREIQNLLQIFNLATREQDKLRSATAVFQGNVTSIFPQLEKMAGSLLSVEEGEAGAAAGASSAGGAIGALANPIGIAVVAAAALVLAMGAIAVVGFK